MFFAPVVKRIQRKTLIPLFAGVPDVQTLSQRGSQGVHHLDGPLGILFHQLLGSNDGGLVGGAEAAGEGHHQKIFAACHDGLHGGFPACGIGSGSGSTLTGPQGVIHGFNLIVRGVGHFLAPEQQGQLHHVNVQLGNHFSGKIATRIGNDPVISHKYTLLGSYAALGGGCT